MNFLFSCHSASYLVLNCVRETMGWLDANQTASREEYEAKMSDLHAVCILLGQELLTRIVVGRVANRVPKHSTRRCR